MSMLKKMAALIAVVACTFAFTDTAYAAKPTVPAKPPPASTAGHTGALTGEPSDGSTASAVTGSVTLSVSQGGVTGNLPIVLANIVLPTGFTWDGGDSVIVTRDDGGTVDSATYTVDFSGGGLTVGGLSITDLGGGTTDFTVSVPDAHITASTAKTAEGTFPVSSQYRTHSSRKIKEQSWLVSTNGIITLDNGTAPSFTGGATSYAGVALDATTFDTYTVDQPATWSLGGANAAMFAISNGGVLSFANGVTPTVDSVYAVDVIATDPLGNTGTRSVTVTMVTSP